ncbi:PREDICTED: SAP30-binding protein-like isoform X3 [Acropora digitifera]|uniref:SAP30-binding protein-like isoform X3 n=1 Tax=Acropora digitifera TaxID=70779 RepID=UPI00077A934D|nr:PREDICTED: SAP30-binding protein-like isoform X3 [Acropora digitifera]
MDHSRVGSLYSLADYGLGESDIEDSDDESRNNEGNPVIYIPKSTAIHATEARIKTSARLVSYDEDEAETEKEKESENVADLIEEELYGDQAPSEKEGIAEETSDGKLSARGDEEHTLTDSADHLESEKSPLKAEESSLVKIASIPAIKMPQLPPEPVGRCSNALQEEIRKKLEKKHEEDIDFNTNIQNRKDFRNPRVCLIHQVLQKSPSMKIYPKLRKKLMKRRKRKERSRPGLMLNLYLEPKRQTLVKNHESAKANGT